MSFSLPKYCKNDIALFKFIKEDSARIFKQADKLKATPPFLCGTWLGRVVYIVLFLPRLIWLDGKFMFFVCRENLAKNSLQKRKFELKSDLVISKVYHLLLVGKKTRWKPRCQLVTTHNVHQAKDEDAKLTLIPPFQYKDKIISFNSPGGVCYGEVKVFLNYLKRKEIPLEEASLIRAASLFKKGAPRASTLIQQFQIMKKRPRKILSKKSDKLSHQLKRLKPGLYHVHLPLHSEGLVKTKTGNFYLFDPQDGLDRYSSKDIKTLGEDLQCGIKGRVHELKDELLDWLQNEKFPKSVLSQVTRLLKRIEKGRVSKSEVESELASILGEKKSREILSEIIYKFPNFKGKIYLESIKK